MNGAEKIEIAGMLLSNIFAVLNILLLLQMLFGASLKCGVKRTAFVMAVFYALNYILVLLGADNGLLAILLVYGCLAFLVFVFGEKRKIKTFLLTIPSTLIYVQWDQLVQMLEKLFGWSKLPVVVNGAEMDMLFLVSDVALFLLLICLYYYCKKRGIVFCLTAGETVFITIFCIFSPVLSSVLEGMEPKIQYRPYRIGWVVFVLFLNAAVVYAIAHRNKARYYKKLSQYYRQQFDEELEYFSRYKKKQIDTTRFRHDWNNHMLVIQSMLKEGNYKEAQQYFAKLCELNERSEKKVLTGNDTVDTVLSVKSDILRESEIQVVCEGTLTALRFMEPVDTCILFSNLIDNAIEANQKCESGRYLKIQTEQTESLFFVRLENPFRGKLKLKAGQVISTKEDGKDHGLGLENAKAVITKYHGEAHISEKDSVFCIEILFPCS